jgi:hypothetical protein
MRGQGAARLYVGDTREAQVAQQAPAAVDIMSGVADARYAAEQIAGLQPEETDDGWDGQFRAGLQRSATALLTVGSLGDGFKSELNRIDRKLNAPINWHPERESGAVAALAQRLGGILAMDAAGSPGDIGFAIVEIVDELYY